MKKLLIYLIPILLLFISGCQENTRPTIPVQAQVPKGLYVTPANNPTTAVSTKTQIALVIGNGSYEHKPLTNTIHDAEDMAHVLKKIGFQVTLKTNLKQSEMKKAIRQFSQRLSQREAVGLFYFSGHGAQVNGKNYLLPIDNKEIQDKYDLESSAVHADQLIKRMEAASKLNIIILDACRDNPYRSVGKSIGRGLARMEGISGSFIAFATSLGTTASDVGLNKRNGLFTGHLIKALNRAVQTHPRIEDLFIEVTKAVAAESGGGQEPWTNSSLKGKYCFGGCLSNRPVATHNPPRTNQNANKLLAVCDRHFQAGRLSGGDGTAFACYNKVLKTDPTNNQALAGLDKIEARYVALAKQAIRNRQAKQAGQYLANLRQIIPASAQLGSLERQLASLQQQRPTPTPTPQRVKPKVKPAPAFVYRKGKTAKIVNDGKLYSTINRTNCLSWPNERMKKISGEDGWGSFHPKNGDIGTIVGEMKHCNSGKKIYLLKIGNHYAPVGYDGVKIITSSSQASGRTAKITDAGQLYSTINRNNCLSWPNQQIKRAGGKDGWGSFYPKNGNVGTIVAEMKHCDSGKKIYLLKIGNHYAPVGYDGVKIISGSQRKTSTTSYYGSTSFGTQNKLFQLGEWMFYYPSGKNDIYLWHTSKNIAVEIVGDSNGWWHLSRKNHGERTVYSNGSQAKASFYKRPWKKRLTQSPTRVKQGSKFTLSGKHGKTIFSASYGLRIQLTDKGVIEILPSEPKVTFKNARSSKKVVFSGN